MLIKPPSTAMMLRDFVARFDPAFWASLKQTPSVDTPRGDGHSILFAPDIFANDSITKPLRRYLAQLGYDTHGWGQTRNYGPTAVAMKRLENKLFDLNDRSGRRVTLIGKSLGGLVMREVAKKHPQRVRRLILNCAPVKHPVGNTLAPYFYKFIHLFDPSLGSDMAAFSQPAAVPTTAFHTKTDGIIAWQSCLEDPSPLAENIELNNTYHCTSLMHPLALKITAARLALPDCQ